MKLCAICRKPMEGHGNRMYCSAKCRLEAKQRRDRIYMREKRFRGEKPKPKPKEPERVSTLDVSSTKARTMGLSYGVYMAMKEGRG